MLRFGTPHDTILRWRRRAILRAGFLGTLGLAAIELTALVAPFIRVNRILGLGNPVAVGTKEEVLEIFSATNDRPILFREGRFFLLHARRDHRRVPQVHAPRLRRAVERCRGSLSLSLPWLRVRQAHRRGPQDAGAETSAALSHRAERRRSARRRHQPAPRHRQDRRVGPVGDRDQRHLAARRFKDDTTPRPRVATSPLRHWSRRSRR